MADPTKDAQGSFQEKFKASCSQAIQKCRDSLDKLGGDLASDLTLLADLKDRLVALEGEAQLLGFDDLVRVLAAVRGVLGSPARQDLKTIVLRGLDSVPSLLLNWTSGTGTQEEAEGIVAALRGQLPEAGEKSPAACRKLPGKKILFMDDSEITREMIKLALEEEGHEVRVVQDLVEFQRTFSSWKPDIILTDINMPDIQGDQVCIVLKQKYHTASTPIVFFSSLGEEELATLTRRAGADGCISKQQGVEKLIEKVNELMEQILW